jgi:hypothetical protein
LWQLYESFVLAALDDTSNQQRTIMDKAIINHNFDAAVRCLDLYDRF